MLVPVSPDDVVSMSKRLLYIGLFLLGLSARSQQCPVISYPLNGDVDIPVDATIGWPAVEGINGYLLSLGTVPGGTDILNRETLGVSNSYSAATGFPDNTEIFVSLSLILFDGPPLSCEVTRFRTVDVTTAPPCTYLVAPDNNAANVTIITEISWKYAPTATGYILSIGTTPGGVDLLENRDVGNVLTYEPGQDLPQDTRIYVRITPYNDNGALQGCTEESFFTGSARDYCEPFIDETTGEQITLKPEIHFPDIVGICTDELPYFIQTEDTADGFRWYRTNSGSAETLISEQPEAPVTEPGRYRYEAYNTRIINGREVTCSDSKLFTVVVSEEATFQSVEVLNLPDGKQITIRVIGSGSYEYALDNRTGPYQDNPVFSRVEGGQHTVFVRDKNGCGIVERSVDRDLTLEDFPNFFTPNGDGINDFWMFISPPENFGLRVETIAIYDRYGVLLAMLIQDSDRWDGDFNGKPLPASDYWFKAHVSNGQELTGHFSLKR